MSGPALPPETTPFWGPCYYSPIMRITRLKEQAKIAKPAEAGWGTTLQSRWLSSRLQPASQS